jgi:hypothetical protein
MPHFLLVDGENEEIEYCVYLATRDNCLENKRILFYPLYISGIVEELDLGTIFG